MRSTSIVAPPTCRSSTSAGSTATSDRRSPIFPPASRPPRRCSDSSIGSRPTGSALRHVDLGGGLGVRYRDEETIDPYAYALAVRQALGSRRQELLFEPGRFLVGDAGVLLTRVIYLKPGGGHDFAIVDAAMNDLLRPALYDAWHAVEPVRRRDGPARRWQIVGPVCESGDFLARDRLLALAEGDLLAVRATGAYGFAMSSNYNSRPRACEVIVDGERTHLARPREDVAELFAPESMLP